MTYPIILQYRDVGKTVASQGGILTRALTVVPPSVSAKVNGLLEKVGLGAKHQI